MARRENMIEKLERADRKERIRWFIILLVMALAGAAAIVWLGPTLTGRLESAEPEKTLRVVVMALSILFIPVAVFGLTIVLLGRRTLSSERFPPPGVKVIRDTVVLEGREARRRGYILTVLGSLLIILSLYGSLYMPFKVYKVFETPLQSGPPN